MMLAGIIVFGIGLLWAVFKGYVIWTIAHDIYNGGGAPTLDFPVICPIPLSVGLSLMLSARDGVPFPWFGFVAYLCLAAFFGFIIWLFDRIGAPERQRQLRVIQQNAAKSENSEPLP